MESTQSDQSVPERAPKRPSGLFRFIVCVVLPLLIIVAGAAATMHLMRTSPKAVPRKKPVFETLVQVKGISFSSQQTSISAMGSVQAARELDLKPRVGGDVIEVNEELIPGGIMNQGQTVLKIDPADYELRVEQLQSDVASAEANLALEMGNQRIAKTEFELLGEDAGEDERALMLRAPQLKQKRASLTSSISKLNEAKLDLTRTELKVPFDSVVKSKLVELGARVTESTTVVRLIGTDIFWVQVSVPIEKLPWIKFPDTSDSEAGSPVKIFTGADSTVYRTGSVIKLAADLEESGRMARIIIEVDDPLCLESENKEQPILFLGSYVKVEIEGRKLDRVFALDRSHLRDNNTIWLLTEDMTLEIRDVDPVFKGATHLLLRDGVRPGDKLIVSNIATPVAGMKVRPEGMGGSGQGMGGGKGRGKSAGMSPQDGSTEGMGGQRPASGGSANAQ